MCEILSHIIRKIYLRLNKIEKKKASGKIDTKKIKNTVHVVLVGCSLPSVGFPASSVRVVFS